MHRILVADPDEKILQTTGQMLRQAGYAVYTAKTATGVRQQVVNVAPHLLLLSAALPPEGGLAVCRALRADPETIDLPILFLADPQNLFPATALQAGGDDYIRQPFAAKELLARLRAHLRWVEAEEQPALPLLRIHRQTREVFVDDQTATLTPMEFNLLAYIGHNPSRWYQTDELLEAVWQYPGGVGDAALVRNHVRNLRRKLEKDPERPQILQSRHGRGYTLAARVLFVEDFQAPEDAPGSKARG